MQIVSYLLHDWVASELVRHLKSHHARAQQLLRPQNSAYTMSEFFSSRLLEYFQNSAGLILLIITGIISNLFLLGFCGHVTSQS